MSQSTRQRLLVLVGLVGVLLTSRVAAQASTSNAEASKHPAGHRRRLVVWPRRRVWLQVDQDAGLRPDCARGRSLFQRVHEQPQVQPVPGQPLDRPEYVAARGGDVPQRRLPREMAGLSRPSRASRLQGRPYRQGLGAGRFQGGRLCAKSRRAGVTSSTSSSLRCRGWATPISRRNFAAFLAERKPGQPFCFWVGGHEPHRPYEEGAGRRAGRDPARVNAAGLLSRLGRRP